ncbi:hypothetical protein RclHR1_12800013 [Rhizophagus clarus]|uniref:Uncharacterized protein n=1 Tax=Rhizophagus clarus TaxID=94130 RepID=A0A2Z6QNR7_9GLOM|nr:hypothetical protein RclHR1_12800013 [Rhizophagus clarus]GES87678.1 hypothetical protein GLOIN_2v1765706 [Rhizophagus clarus]
MTDNNDIEITLNCLIVPVGNLIGVPCNEVNQAITIRANQRVSALEGAIQARLGVTNSLSIRQINPGSVSERPMHSQTPIPEFFSQQPQKAEFFHVTVYSH